MQTDFCRRVSGMLELLQLLSQANGQQGRPVDLVACFQVKHPSHYLAGDVGTNVLYVDVIVHEAHDCLPVDVGHGAKLDLSFTALLGEVDAHNLIGGSMNVLLLPRWFEQVEANDNGFRMQVKRP